MRLSRFGTVLSTIAALVILNPTAAAAAEAYGTPLSVYTGGTTYTGQNIVTIGATRMGSTYVKTSRTVAAGYVGIAPRLYRNGVLCASAATRYNTGSMIGWSYGVNGSCGTGLYDSRGHFLAWTGSSYLTRIPGPSPRLNG